jgi:hypothetical protein
MKTSHCYTIATVLDPRLKLDFYEIDERETIFAEVQVVFARDYMNPVDTAIPDIESDDSDNFFIRTNAYVEPMELRTYCDSKHHCMVGKFNSYNAKDVLAWWKLHQGIYPNLSRMARDYLAIPATSASSERLFSSCKDLITARRNNLNEDTIQAHECLKSWIKKA